MKTGFQNRMNRLSRTALIAALLVTAFFAAPSVRAQNKQAANTASAPVFGHVDIAKAMNDYRKRGQQIDDFKVQETALNGVLRRLSGSAKFLAEADIRTLAGLYEKATPTADEKTRIAALEKRGDDAYEAYRALEQNNNPTEAQKRQFTDYEDAQKKGVDVLNGIRTAYAERLQQRGEEITQKALSDVKAAVAKVAQDKGLAVVFTSDVAIYTANDITTDVIKYINK